MYVMVSLSFCFMMDGTQADLIEMGMTPLQANRCRSPIWLREV